MPLTFIHLKRECICSSDSLVVNDAGSMQDLPVLPRGNLFSFSGEHVHREFLTILSTENTMSFEQPLCVYNE